MTSCTRSLSQSFPLLRSSGLCPILPCSAILSRMLWLCSTVCAAEFASDFISGLDMLLLLLLANANTSFGAGLTQQILVLNHLLQEVVEFFVSNETATQVRQTVAQLEQLAERCYLLHYFRRLKV